MIGIVTLIAIVVLGGAIALASVRLLLGPSIPDRMVAIDTIFLNGVGVIVILGIRYGTRLYLDAALIIAILGFVGTVAVSKFLIRGKVID